MNVQRDVQSLSIEDKKMPCNSFLPYVRCSGHCVKEKMQKSAYGIVPHVEEYG